jgi:NADPH:quinone reductase-like Zn-dependent oxidoreductase
VIVSGEADGGMHTVAKETKRLTDGRGAQVVFDAIGGPGFRHLGDALAEDGSLVVYGWLDPRPAEIPRTWPFTIHTYANLRLTTTPPAAAAPAPSSTPASPTGAFVRRSPRSWKAWTRSVTRTA